MRGEYKINASSQSLSEILSKNILSTSNDETLYRLLSFCRHIAISKTQSQRPNHHFYPKHKPNKRATAETALYGHTHIHKTDLLKYCTNTLRRRMEVLCQLCGQFELLSWIYRVVCYHYLWSKTKRLLLGECFFKSFGKQLGRGKGCSESAQKA